MEVQQHSPVIIWESCICGRENRRAFMFSRVIQSEFSISSVNQLFKILKCHVNALTVAARGHQVQVLYPYSLSLHPGRSSLVQTGWWSLTLAYCNNRESHPLKSPTSFHPAVFDFERILILCSFLYKQRANQWRPAGIRTAQCNSSTGGRDQEIAWVWLWWWLIFSHDLGGGAHLSCTSAQRSRVWAQVAALVCAWGCE